MLYTEEDQLPDTGHIHSATTPSIVQHVLVLYAEDYRSLLATVLLYVQYHCSTTVAGSHNAVFHSIVAQYGMHPATEHNLK